MIRPSRFVPSARLLAKSHLGALLIATALSPLAMPLLPDHGKVGIVAVQAQQRIAIDKIELPFERGSMALSGLVVNGTNLNQAEIESLFKPKSLAALGETLRKMDAAGMTIQSIKVAVKSDKQDFVTTYEGFETGPIKAGLISRLTIKGGGQVGTLQTGKGSAGKGAADKAAGEKFTSTFGKTTLETLDLAGMVSWLLDADPTGKAPMKRLHGKYEMESFAMELGFGKFTMGKAMASSFDARLARKAPIGLMALAEASEAKPGDNAAALPFLTAFLDAYSGMSFGDGSVESINFIGKDPSNGKEIKGSVGKMQFTGGNAPGFVLNDFNMSATDGFFKLKKVGIEGDFYGWMFGSILQGLQASTAAKPGQPDPNAEDLKTLMADIGKSLNRRDVRFVFEGLDADLPPGKNAKSPDRVKMTLTGFDARMGGFVGAVPTRIDYSLNGFRMPVPANSKDQGIQTLRELGIDVLDLSSRIKGTWDEAKTRFVVDDVSADMAKMAKVGVKAELGNIPKPLFESPMTAWTYTLLGANAQSLTFSIENRGGIDNLIAKAAKDQKKSPDQFKMELSAIGPAMVGMYLGGHPDGPALADGLTKFIRTPGSLTVTLRANNPGGLTAMELMAAGQDPGALLQKVKIETQVK